MRPPLEKLAEARRKAQWFLATVPDHSMAETLRTFLAATAPLTKDEAIPVMVANANESGDWTPQDFDGENALEALREPKKARLGFRAIVWAQWATLRHFMGGAE
jgi:hypothetical protein